MKLYNVRICIASSVISQDVSNMYLTCALFIRFSERESFSFSPLSEPHGRFALSTIRREKYNTITINYVSSTSLPEHNIIASILNSTTVVLLFLVATLVYFSRRDAEGNVFRNVLLVLRMKKNGSLSDLYEVTIHTRKLFNVIRRL